MLPLARHPQIDSRVVVFDLEADPEPLLALDADAIAARLYVRQEDLPEGELRIPLKEVHTNKCPALVRWDHLRPDDFVRLGIDVGLAEARAQRLRAAGPALAEKIRRVFARERPAAPVDADAALYDGFLGDGDKRAVRTAARDAAAAAGRAQASPSATRACPNCCSATARATGRKPCCRRNAAPGTTIAAAGC